MTLLLKVKIVHVIFADKLSVFHAFDHVPKSRLHNKQVWWPIIPSK